MELVFLAVLILLMAIALASGYPVAFALPGSAIISILIAAGCGYYFTGDMDAYFAQGGPGNWLSAGVTNFRGVYWEVERDTLIAIPLFVFMGIMLQRSKIAEDLLVSMAQLFGPIRGGLGTSVVFVGALLAATTGILGATVVAMGLISLPAMLRNNYSHSLATGTIAASGTLGQIIPPSIVLIILADQLSSAVDQAGALRQSIYKASTGALSLPSEFAVTSTSAGDMFMGALAPGLVLVGLYMAFILLLSLFRPSVAPSVPFEGSYDRKFAAKVVLSLVPPLTLIFVVLGSIITGIATVNQAGAIGAVGATIMAGYRLREGHPRAFAPALLAILSLIAIYLISDAYAINVRKIHTEDDVFAVTIASIATTVFVIALLWSLLRTYRIDNTLQGVMLETAKTTSLVFIILLGAAMLTAAFRAFGGEELVREFLTSLPGGFWAQFIIVMGVIFVLGFFLDFIEIAVVVVPIVAPILLADPSANITAVWLGVMIGLNIQTSFLTPPFGFALFYLRGVAPAVVKTVSMYKGVVPFIALQLTALAIVGYFPPLVNYLPSRMSLTSETAPPPKNPRLQVCLEENMQTRFQLEGERLRALIADAKAWDLSSLPKKQAKAIGESVELAGQSFGALDAVFAAGGAIEAASVDYRPIHREVRALQAQIRADEEDMKRLDKLLNRLKRNSPDDPKIAEYEARVAADKQEIAELTAAIPDDWDAVSKEFAKLLKAEADAQRTYRRTVDQAYEPVSELITTLAAAKDLAALEARIMEVEGHISDTPTDETTEALKAIEKDIGAVADSGKIRSAVAKVRRNLKPKKPKPEKALKEFNKAIKIYREEVAWRTVAAESLLAQLQTYEEGIRDTIGLRQQRRMPEHVALAVAECGASHRDISLYF